MTLSHCNTDHSRKTPMNPPHSLIHKTPLRAVQTTALLLSLALAPQGCASSMPRAETPADLAQRAVRMSPVMQHARVLSGPHAFLPAPVTSFGAAAWGEHLYVLGGYRGESHHYTAEGQSALPAGTGERLLLIVNAPPLGDGRDFTAEEWARCETQTFGLMARCGLQIDRNPEHTQVTTPRDFERLFPATGGALYGQATHGWMSSFQRPSALSALPGLYLAGGSVHPGPGVPMAAMSGRLAAATLMAHLDSTSRSKTVVISGGISTRSATTATTG